MTRGLALTFQSKYGIVYNENKFDELACDCLSDRFDSCTRGCCPGLTLLDVLRLYQLRNEVFVRRIPARPGPRKFFVTPYHTEHR